MKNKLVSVEKWQAMEGILMLLAGKDIPCSDNTAKSTRKVLDMPDFVESEEDVSKVRQAIAKVDRMQLGATYRNAQAAINALKGGK